MLRKKSIDENKVNIKRVTNIIVNSKKKIKSICLVGMTASNKIDDVIDTFVDDMKTRCNSVALLDLKKNNFEAEKAKQELIKLEAENDFVIIAAPSLKIDDLSMYVTSMYLAGQCDTTIILIEDSAVDGNKAIQVKNELEMNGAQILGAIYIR